MFHLIVSLQIKLVDFSPLNELLEDGHISLGVEFIFDRILARRYETDGLVDSLHLLNSIHAIGDPLPYFLYPLALLFCLFADGVVNLHE